MLAAVLCMIVPQQPPAAGIDVDLARARAAVITDLRYDLSFTLKTPVAEVRGEVALSFTLTTAPAAGRSLVLDFAGEVTDPVSINGARAVLAAADDHLLVPAELLRPGPNTVEIAFAAAVAPAGTPLSVYRDPADQREYCYTLVVPADAHRLYPCFDQPDLKATWSLQLDLPAEWTAVANGEATAGAAADGRRTWTFAETAPLPTYLMAFACGPFERLDLPLDGIPGIAAGRPLHIYYRGSQQEWLDRAALHRLHRDGLAWLCDYFGTGYPFGKLDIVLIPGFPYGGMEHAGAIFYRERALLFDHPPTPGELARRSTLIYHELSHQWFGNLVTMRWFDDLWLKEGFATFVAYMAMEALEPDRLAWLRFLQRVKPRAYAVDGTPGTVPVFQQLQNLADAKSAYGPIVYNKAPAVLRELNDRLGPPVFRKGVQNFLAAHRYGNATWRDLATALEQAARTDLSRWSDRWLLSPSMPQVRVDWRLDDDGLIEEARLLQTPVGGSGTWPIRLELLVIDLAGGTRTVRVDSDAEVTEIPELQGRAGIACVIANPQDTAYGQFLPDRCSREWLVGNVASVTDPLLRAVMVSTLYESVREAEFDPARFADVALDLIAREDDADTHTWLLALLSTCLQRYLHPAQSGRFRARASALLLEQLQQPGSGGRELGIFRFLAQLGVGDDVRALCRSVATNTDLPPGLKPGKEDRFLAVASILAGTAEQDTDAWTDALSLVQQVQESLQGQDVGRDLFLARAATPSATVKAEYFAAYLQLDEPPEQWSQDSLPYFHWPGQEELTLPFLRPALERAQWVKQHRRIFFMPAWLEEFVNGHSDADALAIVDRFLAEAEIDDDVRSKLLQSRDGLARAVRIRAAFGDGR